MSSSLRQRGKKSRETTPALEKDIALTKVAPKPSQKDKSELDYWVAFGVLTVLAFATRFYKIDYPNQIVFDEVHFGKFASYYLQRTFFFDVHPPFGKLIYAFAGWFVGYDGSFLFDNIGDSYISNHVPYIAYRSVPAAQGALTVSVVFLIMWESGYSLPATILATCLMLFDNAHVGETRLILLDATLVFSMAVSILCYIRFYKLRHEPFGRKWWKWLLLTGVALSCVISTKYVGAFTFFSIGIPVLIDLWALLDINRRQGALTLTEFGRHFSARALGLVIVPFVIYLFWFQVHFSILTRSGPGDDFMSPQFQETLGDNYLLQESVGVHYWDVLTIRHKETRVYLHSHPDRYPLRYDDGRISSQGQQVTGYPHNDTNNWWQVIPADGSPDKDRVVREGEAVQLRHTQTDTFLRSHDVASPYHPTNQEFTTASIEEANGAAYNDTLFELRTDKGKGGDVRTKASHLKFIHQPSRVSMWTHPKPLPEWAFGQSEINGNKNAGQSSNIWFFEDITSLDAADPRRHKDERTVKPQPFLTKYNELQRAMFYHNNLLTSSHPYSSHPVQWPFLLRGVSFWTADADTREQIYFLGNPIGWWLASSLLAVFIGLLGADQLSLRRGSDALDAPHLASTLVAGALLEFIFNIEPSANTDGVADAFDARTKGALTTEGKKTKASSAQIPLRERIGGQSLFASWVALAVILIPVIWSFIFFAPITYGTPGLTVDQVMARKWLGYDLHFAKIPGKEERVVSKSFIVSHNYSAQAKEQLRKVKTNVDTSTHICV